MPEILRIYCNNCQRETRHELLRNYEQAGENNEVIDWQIVQCAGCEAISFYERHVSEGPEGWETSGYNIYPTRLKRQLRFFVNAPDNIDQLYKETIANFNSSSLLLCAAGLRALVEGICAHQGIVDGPKRNQETGEYELNRNGHVIRSRNLECKIEGLAERGILTERQARTLHEHRYLGNRALHELEPPDARTLEIAFDIIEHIMDDLYNLPAQVADLQRLRQRNVQ